MKPLETATKLADTEKHLLDCHMSTKATSGNINFFDLTKQERVALWSFAEALKHRDVCVSVYIGKKSMSVTATPWKEDQK